MLEALESDLVLRSVLDVFLILVLLALAVVIVGIVPGSLSLFVPLLPRLFVSFKEEEESLEERSDKGDEAVGSVDVMTHALHLV
jgi:hypothetical protein